MLAESPQAMPKNNLENAIEDAPTTRAEPFGNGSESNLSPDALYYVFSVLYFGIQQLKKISPIARSVTRNPKT